MATPRSALPTQTQGLFGEILRKSAMESGGDPMRRMQIMQDYMGQATPQVLEATGRETTRRQGKEVARAGAQASTEAMQAKGKAQFEMNDRIAKEANSVAKETALISAGATLLGQMATVGIDKWKKEKVPRVLKETKSSGLGVESEDAKPGAWSFDEVRVGRPDEAFLKTMGKALGKDMSPARKGPPVWPEQLKPDSPEAGRFILRNFFGGDSDKYHAWAMDNNPKDWKQAFEMLSAARAPLKGPVGAPQQAAPPPSTPSGPPRQGEGTPLRFRPSGSRLGPLDESLRPTPVLDLSPERILQLGAPPPILTPSPGIPGVDRPADPVVGFGYGPGTVNAGVTPEGFFASAGASTGGDGWSAGLRGVARKPFRGPGGSTLEPYLRGSF